MTALKLVYLGNLGENSAYGGHFCKCQGKSFKETRGNASGVILLPEIAKPLGDSRNPYREALGALQSLCSIGALQISHNEATLYMGFANPQQEAPSIESLCKASIVKHPHICRKKTEMCMCVYIYVYKVPRGFAKGHFYRGFVKPP